MCSNDGGVGHHNALLCANEKVGRRKSEQELQEGQGRVVVFGWRGREGVRVQETSKRTGERHSADHLNDTCGNLSNNGELFGVR
jgi:hypothetical protein